MAEFISQFQGLGAAQFASPFGRSSRFRFSVKGPIGRYTGGRISVEGLDYKAFLSPAAIAESWDKRKAAGPLRPSDHKTPRGANDVRHIP